MSKVTCTKISFDYKNRITFYRRWGRCTSHDVYCRLITYKVRPYWYRRLFVLRVQLHDIAEKNYER